MNIRPIAVFVGAMIVPTFFMNASANNAVNIQEQYKIDHQACKNGTSSEPRATCLQEARAAMVAAKRGKLNSTSEDQLQQNSLNRCQLHTGTDREDCLQRMGNNDNQSGSVEQGGILRKEVKQVIVPENPDTAPDNAN